MGLPVGLAKKANARACIEVLITFITFHYFVNTMISTWPEFFHNIDMTADGLIQKNLHQAMLESICMMLMDLLFQEDLE